MVKIKDNGMNNSKKIYSSRKIKNLKQSKYQQVYSYRKYSETYQLSIQSLRRLTSQAKIIVVSRKN